jgi:multicomponent Na+:H+ antiporter subunit B
MAKNIAVILLLLAMGTLFYNLSLNFKAADSLNETATYYAENTADEVGTANIVTAIVVTYRGLDTLGEVTILFLTAAIVAFLLKGDGISEMGVRNAREASELLKTATGVITPLIFLLGAYIFVNGHLTPGGGFQGGAVIASGLILLLLAKPKSKAATGLFTVVESISGLAYVGLGIAGIFLAGGFLDNSILPLGKVGDLMSAGAVPVIYILIGLKVGSELSNLLARFHSIQGDE